MRGVETTVQSGKKMKIVIDMDAENKDLDAAEMELQQLPDQPLEPHEILDKAIELEAKKVEMFKAIIIEVKTLKNNNWATLETSSAVLNPILDTFVRTQENKVTEFSGSLDCIISIGGHKYSCYVEATEYVQYECEYLKIPNSIFKMPTILAKYIRLDFLE